MYYSTFYCTSRLYSIGKLDLEDDMMAHAEETKAQAVSQHHQQSWMSSSYIPDDLRTLNHDELLQYAQMLSLSQSNQEESGLPANTNQNLLYNQEDEDLELALALSRSEI